MLIACEFSGRVRNAFAARGHEVVSCDLQPTELPCDHNSRHHVGDVTELLSESWDLMIGHPPCTYLAVSGVSWLYHPDDAAYKVPVEFRREHPEYPGRHAQLEAGATFFNVLKSANIEKIALENPKMHERAMDICKKPTQYVQPWMFGDPYVKTTGLWLKNLPKLQPTEPTQERYSHTHLLGPSKSRQNDRSRTFFGLAAAMAAQWG